MRALTPAEEGHLAAAERRRRAAAHYRYRLRALAEAQDFHDALIGGLGVPGTPRQARFKVAVRSRQASLEKQLLGTRAAAGAAGPGAPAGPGRCRVRRRAVTAAALGVPDARAALVSDGDYPGVAVALIRASRSRCLATMFIADLLRPEQPGLLDVVEALADAAWRGVDTRVVIGGSRDSYRIAMTAVTGRAVLLEAGVPARWLTSAPVVGSHAKVLITDDVSLVGSHNWSPGSFSGRQVQDSLAIDSPAMAGVLHTAFEAQWSRAGQP